MEKMEMNSLIKFIKRHKKYTIAVIVEMLLVASYVYRSSQHSYPQNHDALDTYIYAEYLYNCCIQHRYIDFLSGIHVGKGFLYYYLCTLALFLGGASRQALLWINILAFIVAQVYGDYAINRLIDRDVYKAAFSPFWIMCASTFFGAGDIRDARIDFFAMCLFICWINSFLVYIKTNQKGDLAISLTIAVLLAVSRTIMGVYIISIEYTYLIILLIGKKYRFFLRKMLNYAIISTLLIIGCFLPILRDIYSYYVISHVTGAEKYFRANEQGVVDLYSNILFYPKSLIVDHIGVCGTLIFGICICVGMLFLIRNKQMSVEFQLIVPNRLRDGYHHVMLHTI